MDMVLASCLICRITTRVLLHAQETVISGLFQVISGYSRTVKRLFVELALNLNNR